MRFVDDGFLLLARGGRTPHSLPLHPQRGDPLEPRVREELRVLARVARPARLPVRAVGAVTAALAGVLRRGTELGA